MSPVTLAELDPVTRQRALDQINSDTDAAPTVVQETCMTLGDPAAMTNDQLAEIVIDGIKKLRRSLPFIRVLKERFELGDRDSANRLRAPIKGCRSWKEFCSKHLDRVPETIREALTNSDNGSAYRKPSSRPAQHKAVPIACPKCGKHFESRTRLKKHGKTEHGVTEKNVKPFLNNQEPDKRQENPFDLSALFVGLDIRVRPVSPETHGALGNFTITIFNRSPEQVRAIAGMFRNHPEIGTGSEGPQLFTEGGNEHV